MEALVVALATISFGWMLHAHSRHQARLIAEANATRIALAAAAKNHVQHLELHEELVRTIQILNGIAIEHQNRIAALERPWASN